MYLKPSHSTVSVAYIATPKRTYAYTYTPRAAATMSTRYSGSYTSGNSNGRTLAQALTGLLPIFIMSALDRYVHAAPNTLWAAEAPPCMRRYLIDHPQQALE